MYRCQYCTQSSDLWHTRTLCPFYLFFFLSRDGLEFLLTEFVTITNISSPSSPLIYSFSIPYTISITLFSFVRYGFENRPSE